MIFLYFTNIDKHNCRLSIAPLPNAVYLKIVLPIILNEFLIALFVDFNAIFNLWQLRIIVALGTVGAVKINCTIGGNGGVDCGGYGGIYCWISIVRRMSCIQCKRIARIAFCLRKIYVINNVNLNRQGLLCLFSSNQVNLNYV